MTTIFNFPDNSSIVAETIEEAIKIRLEELEELGELENSNSHCRKEHKKNIALLKNKKTIKKEKVQDFQDLNRQYHVVQQDESLTEAKHQYMLETYGVDLDKAKVSHPNHIWTIVEGDDGLSYICPGFHYVNRLGYLQTLKPWKSEDINFLW